MAVAEVAAVGAEMLTLAGSRTGAKVTSGKLGGDEALPAADWEAGWKGGARGKRLEGGEGFDQDAEDEVDCEIIEGTEEGVCVVDEAGCEVDGCKMSEG